MSPNAPPTKEIDTYAELARREAIKQEIESLVGPQPQCAQELATQIDDTNPDVVARLASELAADGVIDSLDRRENQYAFAAVERGVVADD
jgi:dipeptidase